MFSPSGAVVWLSMTQLVDVSAINRDNRWGYMEFTQWRLVFAPEGVARRDR